MIHQVMQTVQQHPLKIGGDVVAGSTIVAGWLGWLPEIVAIVGGIAAIIWYGVQIYYKIKEEKKKHDSRS